MAVAILMAMLCIVGHAVGDEPAKVKSTPQHIAQLIRQLDNESFRVREAAQASGRKGTQLFSIKELRPLFPPTEFLRIQLPARKTCDAPGQYPPFFAPAGAL